MKRFLAVPLITLAAISFQASAACLYITNQYTGTMAPNAVITAYGPFTITGANGCAKANITASVSISGRGVAPKLYIDQQQGSGWVQVAADTGNNVSYLGSFGTYRVRQVNNDAVSKVYSGSTNYGR